MSNQLLLIYYQRGEKLIPCPNNHHSLTGKDNEVATFSGEISPKHKGIRGKAWVKLDFLIC